MKQRIEERPWSGVISLPGLRTSSRTNLGQGWATSFFSLPHYMENRLRNKEDLCGAYTETTYVSSSVVHTLYRPSVSILKRKLFRDNKLKNEETWTAVDFHYGEFPFSV
ncbi:hypothetical protein OUZ56_021955 [Daphnia magna]|uniref:Uncharacterized protein n=1 Tax=Daphnia magna TaxID=35525 RepID=A0ABR0AVG9_9CRUS|nr:hypothetical protein OUZ56_021955 [Daphnia magna]